MCLFKRMSLTLLYYTFDSQSIGYVIKYMPLCLLSLSVSLLHLATIVRVASQGAWVGEADPGLFDEKNQIGKSIKTCCFLTHGWLLELRFTVLREYCKFLWISATFVNQSLCHFLNHGILLFKAMQSLQFESGGNLNYVRKQKNRNKKKQLPPPLQLQSGSAHP